MGCNHEHFEKNTKYDGNIRPQLTEYREVTEAGQGKTYEMTNTPGGKQMHFEQKGCTNKTAKK